MACRSSHTRCASPTSTVARTASGRSFTDMATASRSIRVLPQRHRQCRRYVLHTPLKYQKIAHSSQNRWAISRCYSESCVKMRGNKLTADDYLSQEWLDVICWIDVY